MLLVGRFEAEWKAQAGRSILLRRGAWSLQLNAVALASEALPVARTAAERQRIVRVLRVLFVENRDRSPIRVLSRVRAVLGERGFLSLSSTCWFLFLHNVEWLEVYAVCRAQLHLVWIDNAVLLLQVERLEILLFLQLRRVALLVARAHPARVRVANNLFGEFARPRLSHVLPVVVYVWLLLLLVGEGEPSGERCTPVVVRVAYSGGR